MCFRDGVFIAWREMPPMLVLVVVVVCGGYIFLSVSTTDIKIVYSALKAWLIYVYYYWKYWVFGLIVYIAVGG